MEIHNDFKELLEFLNKHTAEYLIVGGYALAFHGAPRFTGDLDVWVNSSEANACRVLSALEDFGFGSLDITVTDLSTKDRVIQLGVPPVRIDLVTSITGVEWDEAVLSKVSGEYGTVPVFYLGRAAFVKNKRAVGRPKDLADVVAIGSTNGTVSPE